MAGHGVAPCSARGPQLSGAIHTYVLFAFIIVFSTQAMATGRHSSSLRAPVESGRGSLLPPGDVGPSAARAGSGGGGGAARAGGD